MSEYTKFWIHDSLDAERIDFLCAGDKLLLVILHVSAQFVIFHLEVVHVLVVVATHDVFAGFVF